ncbi:uncharacterized protein LOC121985688 [Zingiber officinale]|uniref:Cytochrome c-552/DMSO reductase-like haem-binding domain-containing protein n=1 Tax=Zingiber officinale TaxID=94328 RepID=A0A8J5L960_ZINOF|nr:uncharacterized protein LOC121985688 [Zingiber officinale]KAG6504971.1 hypothetical protein ZIOFF_037319 [Zingiber officinale]
MVIVSCPGQTCVSLRCCQKVSAGPDSSPSSSQFLAAAMPRPLLVLFLLFLLIHSSIRVARGHEHDDQEEHSCGASPDVRVLAGFQPGVITVDGHADDWADIDGSEFPLLPALDFDEDKAYGGGQLVVKAVHDGINVFFMLQVNGEYAYSTGNSKQCPSVALMFQVGENATYQNMGGCADMPGTCTAKSCRGHEVDIMHFSLGNAIPGRLYGGNLMDNLNGTGKDSFGHLVDLYAWNPHCRNLDGIGPSANTSNAQNDWQGAWWHSSLNFHSGLVEEDSPYGKGGEKGTYFFEFSRPLRTMDHFQQDVQFTIGQASKVAVAFWYPTDGKAWSKSDHFSASCNWLPLDIASASSSRLSSSSSNGSWNSASAFALLLSVVSFCVSVFIGYRVARTKAMPFTPIDTL